MNITDITKNIMKGIQSNPFSIIDILVVAYIFYKIYMLIKETRAEQLLKGVFLIILLIPISNLLHLTMLNWIINNTITIGLIALLIIFQPEIRRALEHIGRSAFNDKVAFQSDESLDKFIREISNAACNLSKTNTGALMVIEQLTGLEDIIATGVRLDAILSSALLENIFVVNTPLHDGAVVIRNDRIVAAGCFLPLTDSKRLNKQLGTRHRSAVGISENSDAITVVVSEETGNISIAVNGKITRNYTKEKLEFILKKIIKKKWKKRSTVKERIVTWIKRKKDKKSS